jgi:hypothetical protein
MVRTITDWKGASLEVAESRGGVLAVLDYRRNLIMPEEPHAALKRKLRASGRVNSFPPEQQAHLKHELGFYSDLQSLQSEDALTWSVFGPIACSSDARRTWFARDLLSALKEDVPVVSAEFSLWQRLPHPQTLDANRGPEVDLIVVADCTLLLVEAKWRAPLGTRQGTAKDLDQLQIRSKLIEEHGAQIWPGVRNTMQVVLTEFPQSFANSGIPRLKVVSWDLVCSLASHPRRSEAIDYLQWKRAFAPATATTISRRRVIPAEKTANGD